MGLRIGELCGLTWADIDLNAKVLYIRSTVQRVKSYNYGRQKSLFPRLRVTPLLEKFQSQIFW